MRTLVPGASSRLLWRNLWGWALAAMLAVWLSLTGVAYYTGFHEAGEISDGLLTSAADLLLHQPVGADNTTPPMEARPMPTAQGSAYAPQLHVLVWQNGRLVWDSHGVVGQLPGPLALGHQTLSLSQDGRAQDWRVYVAETGQPGAVRRVAVLMDLQRRQALAADIAQHLVAPALVFLPLVALVLAWAIRRGLRPLEHLSAKIQALNVDAGQSLTLKQPYQELGVMVNAINQLVQRLASQVQRERRFAADVAHELRTPLTSLVLQARLARDNPGASEQTQALQAVEQGAMRAGRILSQLLDLARAQSLADDGSESVDLCALAYQVVSEHAALAHALGQEIALEAPEQPLRVPGRTTLLELALRNLVDNALRHNPAGTYVEVRVAIDGTGRTVLSVSDDGADADALHGGGGASSDTLAVRGMGIGLTLVERIAQSQGVLLVRDGAAAPFSKRYALIWENAARSGYPG